MAGALPDPMLVVASAEELPAGRRVWGTGGWLPPEQREALDWLTFAEGYGAKPGFLRDLDRQGVPYVGEVPKSFRCFTARPRPGRAGHRADDLVRHSPVFHRQPWQAFRLARQTAGEQPWQAKEAPVWLAGDAAGHRLIWARNERTGEQKYFVCGGAAEAPLGLRLRVGFARWNVEHALRVSKSELGFRHFEGRSYTGLMRHLTLTLIVLGFGGLMTFSATPRSSTSGRRAGTRSRGRTRSSSASTQRGRKRGA